MNDYSYNNSIDIDILVNLILFKCGQFKKKNQLKLWKPRKKFVGWLVDWLVRLKNHQTHMFLTRNRLKTLPSFLMIRFSNETILLNLGPTRAFPEEWTYEHMNFGTRHELLLSNQTGFMHRNRGQHFPSTQRAYDEVFPSVTLGLPQNTCQEIPNTNTKILNSKIRKNKGKWNAISYKHYMKLFLGVLGNSFKDGHR